MKLRFGVSLAAAFSLLAGSGAALAQDPTGQTYSGVGQDIDQSVGGVAGDVVTGGTLPFTGLDIAFVLAVGLVLAGIGLLTRRLARS